METRYNLKDTKTIPIAVPEGYYLLVELTTMANFMIRVTVSEGETVLFSQSRQSMKPLPVLTGFYRCGGNGVMLSIDIADSKRIDARMNSMDFNDAAGNLVLRTVTVIGEDNIDEDYNDFIINFTIMAKDT